MTIAAIGQGTDHNLLVVDDLVATSKGPCRRDKIRRTGDGVYATVTGDELVLDALQLLASWGRSQL
jgi:hypothetical protein